MEFDHGGHVRRTEFYLRAHFPEVDTKIFKTGKYWYEIYCSNLGERFDDVSAYFDDKIRPVATPVKLTKDYPSEILEELPPIADNEIPKDYEGISGRTIDMLNLLAARFKNILASSYFSPYSLAISSLLSPKTF